MVDETFKSPDELTQRFFDELIGVNPAAKRLSYQLKTGAQLSERKLLAVEAEALRLRLAGKEVKQKLVEFAQAHLHDKVANELLQRLGKIDLVTQNLFELGDAFYRVLDLLSNKTVSMNKLDTSISAVSWLKDDLLRLVNRPQYRDRTTSGAIVKEVKTALRYLGVENLQLLVPVYAMRRSLPYSTDPFTTFKDNLWSYTLATAIAAKRLAEDTAEHPYNAFCVALFHSLGHAVVTRLYLRTYQQVKKDELLKARQKRDNELTDALDSLEPDGSFLSNSLQEFAVILSADVTSRWQLKTLPLCQTLDQLAEGIGFAGSSPLARLVQQAQVYVQWQYLKKRNLIDEQQSKYWLGQVDLRTDSINVLARTNLNRLNIDL